MQKIMGSVESPDGLIVPTYVVVSKVVGSRRRHIGSQNVDSKGRFCFEKLTDGKYLVETGYHGFCVMLYYVTIRPNDRSIRARRLNITLEVSH
ncbi:MAG: hypothetical protein ABL959_03245 [Pyrinomonadaceae bacterium]